MRNDSLEDAAPQEPAEAIRVARRRPTDFVDSSGAPRGSGLRDDVPEYGLLVEAPLQIPDAAMATRIGPELGERARRGGPRAGTGRRQTG